MNIDRTSEPVVPAHELSDKELVQRVCDGAANSRECAGELWKRYEPTIHDELRKRVMGGMCPPNWDKPGFFVEVASHVQVNFLARLPKSGFRNFRGPFEVLCRRLARSTILDDLRKATRSREVGVDPEDPVEWKPPETTSRAGEMSAAVTSRNDPETVLGTRERSEILEGLLEHAAATEEGRVSATAIRLRYHRDCGYEDIASRLLNKSLRTAKSAEAAAQAARRLVSRDLDQIRKRLKRDYGVWSSAQL